MLNSEVANLRNQIEQELTAMRLGLSGLAAGTSKHEFIESKMNRLGVHQDQLAKYIGSKEAIEFSCQAYMRIVEKP